MLKLLHQSDHDPMKLADVERITPVPSERIHLIDQQNGLSRFCVMEQLAQMNGRLTKVRTHDCIKPDHEHRKPKLARECGRGETLPTSGRTMEQQATAARNG